MTSNWRHKSTISPTRSPLRGFSNLRGKQGRPAITLSNKRFPSSAMVKVTGAWRRWFIGVEVAKDVLKVVDGAGGRSLPQSAKEPEVLTEEGGASLGGSVSGHEAPAEAPETALPRHHHQGTLRPGPQYQGPRHLPGLQHCLPDPRDVSGCS